MALSTDDTDAKHHAMPIRHRMRYGDGEPGFRELVFPIWCS